MLESILGALLPMVVAFLLGFVAAWRGDFGPKDAAILNRMVLLYAVPLLLFAGTVSTPRAELSQDLPLLIALCVAIVGLYGAVLLLSRFAFRRRLSTSALAGLTASAPAVPFSAVLGYLFGGPGAVPIAMASLVVNLTVIPVTILLLTLDTAGEESQGKCPAKEEEHLALPPVTCGSLLWKLCRNFVARRPRLDSNGSLDQSARGGPSSRTALIRETQWKECKPCGGSSSSQPLLLRRVVAGIRRLRNGAGLPKITRLNLRLPTPPSTKHGRTSKSNQRIGRSWARQ